MGALSDGDSSVCSTVDYQPPEPEKIEEEEEEPDPLEPEACFTDSMNHLRLIHIASKTRVSVGALQKPAVRAIRMTFKVREWG